ncbi:MAG: cellulose biosynthesis protein BcsG [Candidimonas sp.]|nr:MAG: cellulose biosynthesis protein BcsG [Candidimonas sp.]
MASWNLYFLLKLYLYFKGSLVPLWGVNLLFILVLIVPLRRRWLRVVRALAGLAVAFPLMYYESTLPPFAHLVEQFGGIMKFDTRYLLELASRFFPATLLAGAAAALVAYFVINRWVRVSTFVLIAFLVLPVWRSAETQLRALSRPVTVAMANVPAPAGAQPMVAAGDYDGFLARFRQTEATRKVSFKPADTRARFDIILIHICSLAWDDLRAAKALHNPLLSHFDYLFTNFSSAVSYSGPAAIRLLRADCGQAPHKDLYQRAPQGCYLMSTLKQEGYTPEVALNHDGRFDDFIGDVMRNIEVPDVKPMSLEGVPTAMQAFDGSPIRDDFATLDRWWKNRQSVAGPVALYYNTITMHDGNHLPDSNLTSVQSYPLRVNKLMNEIDRFADVIQASGRKAVLVFVPEHGAALDGDSGQIAGLRDIPTPKIINIPVGVRLINFTGTRGPTQIIREHTSYLALAQLLANLVADSPFRPDAPPLIHYATDLPRTPMVGENEGTVTLQTPKGYVMRNTSGDWVAEK